METKNINEGAEKEQSQTKSGILSGAGAAVGAGVGVAAATLATQDADAKEAEETPETSAAEAVVAEPQQQATYTAQSASQHQSTSHQQQSQSAHKAEQHPVHEDSTQEEHPLEQQPSQQEHKEDNDGDEHPVEPIDDSEPTVEVVAYETVDNEDGTQSDIAVVAVDGTPVLVADMDKDGTADLMAVDLNENGTIEDEEIIDISESNIAMEPLQQAAEMNNDNMIADGVEPDYINDANVDDYIA